MQLVFIPYSFLFLIAIPLPIQYTHIIHIEPYCHRSSVLTSYYWGFMSSPNTERLREELTKIDDQHERITSIIDFLLCSFAQDLPIADLQEKLKELINLLHTHFTDENSLFSQYGYPQMTSHMQEHKAIFEEINAQYQLIKRGEKTLSPILADHFKYLEDCHIANADKAFLDYFRQKLTV